MNSLRVLIIDKDRNISSLLNEQLQYYKIKPKIANTGIEAYKILYNTPLRLQFNYIITNIGLPDENGIEIIKYIKEKFTSKIIIYTYKKFDIYKNKCQYDYFCNKDEKTPLEIVNIILKEFKKL